MEYYITSKYISFFHKTTGETLYVIIQVYFVQSMRIYGSKNGSIREPTEITTP